MYLTYTEGKSVVAESFIRLLKNKIYKHMTAVSKIVYFDVLDIVNKYNNTFHRAIKMKPIDITSDSYAEYSADSNKKDPKFKVGDHLKNMKIQNIFAKGYSPHCSEEIFIIIKIKNKHPWTYVISNLIGEEIVGTFYEKELQKTTQKEFGIEKLKEKEISHMSNGKDMIVHLINRLTKKGII